jgi:hypothetical protein
MARKIDIKFILSEYHSDGAETKRRAEEEKWRLEEKEQRRKEREEARIDARCEKKGWTRQEDWERSTLNAVWKLIQKKKISNKEANHIVEAIVDSSWYSVDGRRVRR